MKVERIQPEQVAIVKGKDKPSTLDMSMAYCFKCDRLRMLYRMPKGCEYRWLCQECENLIADD